MSRIDDALARARTVGREELQPPAATDPAAATGLEFPVEPGAPADPLHFDEFTEGPSEETTNQDVAAAVIDVDGDLSTLPGVEKLMVNSRLTRPVEQYRRLAARLLMARAETGTQLVMVTSAFPAEGKTLTSSNLALTLSESYKRDVLLIDGDLRRPTIHELFRIPNVSGLNDGLQLGAERKIPLINYTDHLSILTAGRPDSDPMSVLSGERMRRVLREAKKRFEWVIIDTPPVALLPDAHLLSGLVDAVLLVIQSGQTPLPALKMAVQAVGRERVLGVVLNRADNPIASAAYDYYGNYGSEKV
jgi:protein-tyrosine kinase